MTAPAQASTSNAASVPYMSDVAALNPDSIDRAERTLAHCFNLLQSDFAADQILADSTFEQLQPELEAIAVARAACIETAGRVEGLADRTSDSLEGMRSRLYSAEEGHRHQSVAALLLQVERLQLNHAKHASTKAACEIPTHIPRTVLGVASGNSGTPCDSCRRPACNSCSEQGIELPPGIHADISEVRLCSECVPVLQEAIDQCSGLGEPLVQFLQLEVQAIKAQESRLTAVADSVIPTLQRRQERLVELQQRADLLHTRAQQFAHQSTQLKQHFTPPPSCLDRVGAFFGELERFNGTIGYLSWKVFDRMRQLAREV